MALGLYEYESSSYGDHLAGRFEPEPPPAPRASAPQRTAAQIEADDEWAFSANMDRVRDGDEVAKFAMVDLERYETRMRRAVATGDYDAAADISAKIDNFVNLHYDDLSPWTQLSQTGERGKKVGKRIEAALNGGYLSEWGTDDGKTPQALLDEQSPDGRARRAERDARELSLGSNATARAIVDRDDPAHAAYSLFAPLLDRSRTALPMAADERSRLTAYLHSVEGLGADMAPSDDRTDGRPRFSSWRDMGSFVAAFDRYMNRKDMNAGDEILRKSAAGWLAANGATGISANDYLMGFKTAVDQLVSARTGVPPPAPGSKTARSVEARMELHDANAIVARLFEDVPEAASSPGRYVSAVASAAADVRKAEDLFGLNPPRDGYADKVVQMAKRGLGIPGADDGGLSEFLMAGASACARFCSPSTKELVSALAESKGSGAVGTVPANNMYANVEMLMGQAFGRAVSSLANGVNGAKPEADSWQALQRFAMANPDARDKVVGEVARVLLSCGNIDDGGSGRKDIALSVARDIASGMVDMAFGTTDDMRTLEERIRDATGRFDPKTGAAAVPAERQLTPAIQEADFASVMNRAAADPTSVIPATRADRPLTDAVQKFAKLYADRAGKGKSVYEDFSAVKALGDVLVEGIEGLSEEHGLANVLKKGALMNVLSPKKLNVGNRPEVDGQKWLSDVIEAGGGVFSDSNGVYDALLLKAVMAGDKEVPWATTKRETRLVPSGRTVVPQDRDGLLAKSVLTQLGVDPKLPGNAMVQRLLAMPQAANSPLLRSGLVNSEGKLDVKRFFAGLQQRQWSDPDTTIGGRQAPAADGGNPVEAEIAALDRQERQDAALRAYRRFGGTGNYLVRKLTSDCVEHARSEGYRGEDLGVMEKRYAKAISDAWRNGGPVAAERAAAEFTARRRRFYPGFDQNASGGRGKFDADIVIPSRELLTDAEWEEQVALRTGAYAAQGYIMPSDVQAVFRSADVTGFAKFRAMQAHKDKATQAALIMAAKQQAKDDPYSVGGNQP